MREHNAVVQELEEVFFERNFEPGEDEENLSRAKKLYGEWREKAESLAQDLEDGLVIDEVEAVLVIQSYCLAKKFYTEFSA